MTVRDMKVFLAVCEAQSMSAAAAKLSISQSAVSQAIREIERHFDTKLFDRVGNKVYLTDSGRNMASCSTHVISYLSHMESVMRSDNRTDFLHVGSFGPFLIVDLVKRYKDVDSSVEVILHVFTQNELLSMLSTGVVDVILTDSKPNLPGAVSVLLCRNQAAFICHPNSRLHPALEAENPVLQIKDLEGMPMLLRDEGNHSRTQFEELMVANHVNFFCKGMFSNYDGIFTAVENDLGIGLTTGRTGRAFSKRYKQIQVEGAEIYQEVYLSYMQRRENMPHLQNFIAFAKSHVPNLYEDLFLI